MKKRALDVVVGFFMCLVATPIIAVGTLIAMVTLRTTSPFFKQKRLGQHNAELTFPKLRSLPTSMPAYGLKTEMCFKKVPLVVNLNIDGEVVTFSADYGVVITHPYINKTTPIHFHRIGKGDIKKVQWE